MNKSEVLTKAADLLPGHWMRGNYTDYEGHYCMIGFVAATAYPDSINNECGSGQGAVMDTEKDYCRILEKAIKASDSDYDEDFDSVADWNDDEARTEDEVVAVLRKAAELAKDKNAN